MEYLSRKLSIKDPERNVELAFSFLHADSVLQFAAHLLDFENYLFGFCVIHQADRTGIVLVPNAC